MGPGRSATPGGGYRDVRTLEREGYYQHDGEDSHGHGDVQTGTHRCVTSSRRTASKPASVARPLWPARTMSATASAWGRSMPAVWSWRAAAKVSNVSLILLLLSYHDYRGSVAERALGVDRRTGTVPTGAVIQSSCWIARCQQGVFGQRHRQHCRRGLLFQSWNIR